MASYNRHSSPSSHSPLRIQSWKYAWGENAAGGPSRRPAVAPGAGRSASERLYQSAKSARVAREALKREIGGYDDLHPPSHKPQTNARSAQLAAGRYERVMASQASSRYRHEALSIARAKGEPERADIYNYGDMLYQEAQMANARREAWRREQLLQKHAEEAENLTFKPNISASANASSAGTSVASDHGGGPDVFLERMARLDEMSRQRKLALEEEVRAEELRQFTFQPHARNRVSKRLTEGYGEVLAEMEVREREREQRLRALRERQAALDRGCAPNHPDISRSQMSHSAHWRDKGDGGAGALWEGAQHGADSAEESEGGGAAHGERPAPVPAASARGVPVHERLHSTHTSAYLQSLLPPATGDPECTFQPNLHRGAPAKVHPYVAATVGDALYRDAHNRVIRRAMLEAQAEADLNERRNQTKLSSASDRYAQRRLERDVLEIYETLGRTAGGLRYDEFGAAMVELGFLRSAEAHAKKTASAMASAVASAVSGVTGIRVPSSAVSSAAAVSVIHREGAAAGADAPPS
eukprot:jgi/Chrpa1/23508/Chrysochromulina_OHIO_Genome00027786-RA